MELISQLMKSLGISEAQATGGVGALLSMVKNALGESNFSQIANAIPDVSSLLDSARKVAGVADCWEP